MKEGERKGEGRREGERIWKFTYLSELMRWRGGWAGGGGRSAFRPPCALPGFPSSLFLRGRSLPNLWLCNSHTQGKGQEGFSATASCWGRPLGTEGTVLSQQWSLLTLTSPSCPRRGRCGQVHSVMKSNWMVPFDHFLTVKWWFF